MWINGKTQKLQGDGFAKRNALGRLVQNHGNRRGSKYFFYHINRIVDPFVQSAKICAMGF